MDDVGIEKVMLGIVVLVMCIFVGFMILFVSENYVLYDSADAICKEYGYVQVSPFIDSCLEEKCVFEGELKSCTSTYKDFDNLRELAIERRDLNG